MRRWIRLRCHAASCRSSTQETFASRRGGMWDNSTLPFNDRIVELYKQEYCSVTKWRAREMSERMGESGQPFSSVFALYSSACAAFKFFTDSRTKSSALWMDLMFRS